MVESRIISVDSSFSAIDRWSKLIDPIVDQCPSATNVFAWSELCTTTPRRRRRSLCGDRVAWPVNITPVASTHAATNAACSCLTAGPSKRTLVSRQDPFVRPSPNHWSSMPKPPVHPTRLAMTMPRTCERCCTCRLSTSGPRAVASDARRSVGRGDRGQPWGVTTIRRLSWTSEVPTRQVHRHDTWPRS